MGETPNESVNRRLTTPVYRTHSSHLKSRTGWGRWKAMALRKTTAMGITTEAPATSPGPDTAGSLDPYPGTA
jgi:hypothetical protein